MTGYRYNAVTPFALRKDLDVILSDNIAKLGFFYLGGGAVDLKIRVATDEFIEKYTAPVYTGDIVYKWSFVSLV